MKTGKCFSKLHSTRSSGHTTKTRAFPVNVAIWQNKTRSLIIIRKMNFTGFHQVFTGHEDDFVLACIVKRI